MARKAAAEKAAKGNAAAEASAKNVAEVKARR